MTTGRIPPNADSKTDSTGSSAAALIRSLRDPSAYDHPASEIRTVETHISWVLLTGKYAYKIKKPVTLPFLDFGTLEKRRLMCEEELRLNRRLAPELYLAVVSITGSAAEPLVNGTGEAIEYAVKMVQFDPGSEVRTLVAGGLSSNLVDELAHEVARFHLERSRTCTDRKYGTPGQIRQRVKDNFEALRPHLQNESASRLEKLEAWVDTRLDALGETMERRISGGFIRECHGDLHLGNMVVIDGRVRLFDCLEFNAQMRWIDVMSEVAFVVMDFDYHGRTGYATRFLNQYLFRTGDYAGLELLPLYRVYRAMVRAKVACIRCMQSGESVPDAEVDDHLSLALRYVESPTPRLIITHGFSGSGKSWWSQRLAHGLSAVHVRSDVERGRAPSGTAAPGGGDDRYSPRNIARNYRRLLNISRSTLAAGYTVIADATFLKAGQRKMFLDMAAEAGVPVSILDLQCDEDVLKSRIAARRAAGGDPSEATLQVLKRQMRESDPLSEPEKLRTVVVDAGEDSDVDRIVSRISRIS